MLYQKKYVSNETKNQIEEKWFLVYNYISLRELMLTVQKDYLQILSKINLPFGIITIFLWIFSFFSLNFIPIISFVLFVYFMIFIVLIYKLSIRTYFFLLISNIVYTSEWVIIWKELFLYNEDEKLENSLRKYEIMFDEFLSKSSNIEQIISSKKSELLKSNWNILKKWWEWFGKILDNVNSKNSRNLVQLAIVAMISFAIYIMLLYLFYYIWILVWYVIFFFFSQIIKIILAFKKPVELKIKENIESIDSSFNNMNKIWSLIWEKIDNFNSWEISNISNIIWENLESFYLEIWLIMKKKEILLKILKESIYKDFINFTLLTNYLKLHFNKPILSLIWMLEQTEDSLKSWIKNIENTISENKDSLLEKTLETKIVILQRNLEILLENKEKLGKSVI